MKPIIHGNNRVELSQIGEYLLGMTRRLMAQSHFCHGGVAPVFDDGLNGGRSMARSLTIAPFSIRMTGYLKRLIKLALCEAIKIVCPAGSFLRVNK